MKGLVVKSLMYVKYRSHTTIPKTLEVSVELPLEDEKFMSLQEQDPEIRELHDKVKSGMYHGFYLVKNNVLFRSIVDNGQKFETRVIPASLIDM